MSFPATPIALPFETLSRALVFPVPIGRGVVIHCVDKDPGCCSKGVIFDDLGKFSWEGKNQYPGTTIQIGQGKHAYCVDARLEWRGFSPEEPTLFLTIVVTSGTMPVHSPVLGAMAIEFSTPTSYKAKLISTDGATIIHWRERFEREDHHLEILSEEKPLVVI